MKLTQLVNAHLSALDSLETAHRDVQHTFSRLREHLFAHRAEIETNDRFIENYVNALQSQNEEALAAEERGDPLWMDDES